MKLKILLIPIWEKLPSFKVMACSVWSSEPFTGLEVENTPPPPLSGAYRVKPFSAYFGQFSKHLCDFKRSYLDQMATKN